MNVGHAVRGVGQASYKKTPANMWPKKLVIFRLLLRHLQEWQALQASTAPEAFSSEHSAGICSSRNIRTAAKKVNCTYLFIVVMKKFCRPRLAVLN